MSCTEPAALLSCSRRRKPPFSSRTGGFVPGSVSEGWSTVLGCARRAVTLALHIVCASLRCFGSKIGRRERVRPPDAYRSLDGEKKSHEERRGSHLRGPGPYRRSHSRRRFRRSQSSLPGLLIPGKGSASSPRPPSFLQPLADLGPADSTQQSKSPRQSSALRVAL